MVSWCFGLIQSPPVLCCSMGLGLKIEVKVRKLARPDCLIEFCEPYVSKLSWDVPYTVEEIVEACRDALDAKREQLRRQGKWLL